MEFIIGNEGFEISREKIFKATMDVRPRLKLLLANINHGLSSCDWMILICLLISMLKLFVR